MTTAEKSAVPKKLYQVDEERFPSKREACTYAQTASRMFSARLFIIRYDGFAIETYYQGKKKTE